MPHQRYIFSIQEQQKAFSEILIHFYCLPSSASAYQLECEQGRWPAVRGDHFIMSQMNDEKHTLVYLES